jgi:hypothetical protein
MSKIGLMDVKNALKDERFRKSLPDDMTHEMVKYLQNPGCGACGTKLFRKILRDCRPQLQAYFPGRDIYKEEEEVAKLAENHWMVINCNADELEDRLKKLPAGRKQIAIARYEDKVTVVVNELDILW